MKIKTNRSARKRFHIAKSGALRRRKTRQAHFNAKATGNETRRKHSRAPVSASDQQRVIDLLPYLPLA